MISNKHKQFGYSLNPKISVFLNSRLDIQTLIIRHRHVKVLHFNSRLDKNAFHVNANNNTPSNCCSKFNFKSLPHNHHDLVITGKEAVNFVLLRGKLEKALGSFASENVKIRLVFGVVNVHPIDTLKPVGFLEGFSIIKDALVEMFKFVPYHKQGIEFRFASEPVHILVKMINEVISDQGKDLEKIHIWLSFWPSEEDDFNNDDDDDGYNDDDDAEDYDDHKKGEDSLPKNSLGMISLSPSPKRYYNSVPVSFSSYFSSFSCSSEEQENKEK